MRLGWLLSVLFLVGCQTQSPISQTTPSKPLTDLSHLDQPMTWADAAHLERRIGFGTPLERTQRYVGMTRRAAIDLVIAELAELPPYTLPPWIDTNPWNQVLNESSRLGQCGTLAHSSYITDLQARWAESALVSDVPQHDRLVFLWNNLFATGYQLYGSAHGWARHYEILYTHAATSGRQILRQILESPALLLYLTNDKNFIRNVNENLGREYLELFTLGAGNYTEQDIRNLSKVFAGHTVNEASQKYYYRRGAGTPAAQRVLGRDVATLDDVVEMVIAHPAHARFWAERFYREYVSLETPPESAIGHVANAYLDGDTAIDALLEATLELPEFWAPESRYALVKSPADLLLGAARTTEMLGRGEWATREFPIISQRMGMSWIEPPNVAGYPGGLDWFAGELLESRLIRVKQFFEYQTDKPETLLPFSQVPDTKVPPSNTFSERYHAALDNQDPEQLVIGSAYLVWVDAIERRNPSAQILLRDVWLGDQYWQGLKVRYQKSREYGTSLIRFESKDCAPGCVSTYVDQRPDRRGSMKFRTAWPNSFRHDGYGALNANERLFIRRLAELPHYFKGVMNKRRMGRHGDKTENMWLEFFEDYRERVPRETTASGNPSVDILATNTTLISEMCKYLHTGPYNLLRRGRPDAWQGPEQLTQRLAQAGLNWDEYLLPELSELHLGSESDRASIIARLSQDGFQLK